MSHPASPTEKGIEATPRKAFTSVTVDPQTGQGSGTLSWEAARWLDRWREAFPLFGTYSVTINPAAIAANTTAEETFTVTGLTTSDVVFVNKPTETTGIVVGNARVSAADTLALTFANVTGGSINPAEETYLVFSIRL